MFGHWAIYTSQSIRVAVNQHSLTAASLSSRNVTTNRARLHLHMSMLHSRWQVLHGISYHHLGIRICIGRADVPACVPMLVYAAYVRQHACVNKYYLKYRSACA